MTNNMGLAILGAGALSAGAGAFGSSRAASAQAQATRAATDSTLQATREGIAAQREMFDLSRADMAPWRNMGQRALATLGGDSGFSPVSVPRGSAPAGSMQSLRRYQGRGAQAGRYDPRAAAQAGRYGQSAAMSSLHDPGGAGYSGDPSNPGGGTQQGAVGGVNNPFGLSTSYDVSVRSPTLMDGGKAVFGGLTGGPLGLLGAALGLIDVNKSYNFDPNSLPGYKGDKSFASRAERASALTNPNNFRGVTADTMSRSAPPEAYGKHSANYAGMFGYDAPGGDWGGGSMGGPGSPGYGGPNDPGFGRDPDPDTGVGYGGFADGGQVRGHGTGRADNIKAKLSPNEYVIDAETVALLGDGNPDAGAQKLNQMRAEIRRHKGRALSEGEISPDARGALDYVKGYADGGQVAPQSGRYRILKGVENPTIPGAIGSAPGAEWDGRQLAIYASQLGVPVGSPQFNAKIAQLENDGFIQSVSPGGGGAGQPFYDYGDSPDWDVPQGPAPLRGEYFEADTFQPDQEFSQPLSVSEAELRADPSYQFRLSEGLKALQNQMGSMGMRASGQNMRAITDYGQGLASTEYGNVYARKAGDRATRYAVALDRYNARAADRGARFNRLAGLAGMGQAADSQIAGQAAQVGSNLANLYGQQGSTLANLAVAGGQAKAAGIGGIANAVGGGVNSGLNNYLAFQQLQQQNAQTNNFMKMLGGFGGSGITGTF